MASRCVVRCNGRVASALADVQTSSGEIRFLGVCELGPIRLGLMARGLSPERALGLAKAIGKKKAVGQVKAQARACVYDPMLRKALERPRSKRDGGLVKAPPSIAQELAAQPQELPQVASGFSPLAALAGAFLPAPWPWNWHAAGARDSGTSALLNSFAGPTVRRGVLEWGLGPSRRKRE